MHTLVLNELQGCNFSGVYSYLMENPDSFYSIHLNKIYPGKKDYYSTFNNYSFAAFIGEKLFEVSETFAYWVPPDLVKEPFIFELQVRDIDHFGDVLFYIISSYLNKDKDLYATFEAAVWKFYDVAWHGEPDYACWGLITVADEIKIRYERSEDKKIRKRLKKMWNLK